MPDDAASLRWQMVDYEGFEIHVATSLKDAGDSRDYAHETRPGMERYTYVGYVCHPGANAKLPGHAVPFHADGEESFKTLDDATYEAVHVGRSIIEGTHPDLSVLPLVTGGT